MSILDIDLKGGLNKIKNTVLNRSPVEIKVRDATSNDPWAASGSLKQEVAEATYNYEDSKIVMQTIWQRVQDTGKNWRHVYKALQLIEYLVGHGAERVIDDCKEQLHAIRSLKNFTYTDEKGRDQGVQVRELSKKIVKLLTDDQAIIEERKISKKTKDKFIGISSEESRFRRPTSSYDSDRKSKYGGDDDDDKPAKKPSYDDDDDKPAKRPSYDDDDDKPKKKPTPQPEDDEAPEEPPKPAVVKTSKPRKPSVGSTQAPAISRPPQAKPAPQPKQEESIFDFDIITSTKPTAPQPTKAPAPVFVADPFEVPQPKVNTAVFKNDFDNSFGDDFEAKWQEGDANDTSSSQPTSDQPQQADESLFDLHGIVDLSLGDKKKTVATGAKTTVAANDSQKPKSLNDMKKDKGGIITPKKVNMPMTTAPTYPPHQPPQAFYPPQPNPYAPYNPFGAPAPAPYNPYSAAPPMMGGRGYPPQPQMGRGAPQFYQPPANNNAFNF